MCSIVKWSGSTGGVFVDRASRGLFAIMKLLKDHLLDTVKLQQQYLPVASSVPRLAEAYSETPQPELACLVSGVEPLEDPIPIPVLRTRMALRVDSTLV